MAKKKSSKARGTVSALHALKNLKKNPEDKKSLVIKDISRVLSDIEESKKSRKIIYFSTLEGKGVYDAKKKRLGKVKDLCIAGGDVYPEVSHLLLAKKPDPVLIPWKNVSKLNAWIELDKPIEAIDYRVVKDDDVFLGKNILDKQVVDVNGLKVIRVNDIALTIIKNKLSVVNIDVGSRSMLRRLGLQGVADKIPWFEDHPVPWGSVEPLTRSLEKIHLKVPCARVSDLHPADVAEVFEELSTRERKILLRSMKSDKAAKVILECEPDVRRAILKSLKIKRLAAILERMHANDAANLLSEFDQYRQAFILKHMGKEAGGRTQEMLSFKAGSVARFMSDTYITVNKESTTSEVLSLIRALPKRPENFHYIYVTDDSESLCGVISLKNLIIANPDAKIKDVMVTKLVTIEINDPVAYVEEIISKYDLLALPVVDLNNKIRGIVNIADVLDLIVEKTKLKESIALSEVEKDKIIEKKKIRKYYSAIIKDIGQLLKDIEPTGIARKKFK